MNRQMLQEILNRAETDQMLLGWEDVSEWARGAVDSLRALKLLRAASPASVMDCSDCERECLAAPVVVVPRPDGTQQAYLECPVYMRVEKPIDRLNRWQVDIDGLAARLAGELGGTEEELMPGRLWMVGRPEIGGVRTEVLFARGLGWPDGERVLRDVRSRKRSQSAVVLVPALGGAGSTSGDFIEILPLDKILSLDGEVLSVDRSAINGAAERTHGAVKDTHGGRPDGSRFKRDGQRWSVVYDGKHVSLNHSDGAMYIAYLMEHPNTSLHVRELYVIAHPQAKGQQASTYANMSSEELGKEDLILDNECRPTDGRDDAELLATYRSSRNELQRELEMARRQDDSRHVDELQTKLDDLTRLMSAEFGLDGSPRQPGDPNKLAYDRVSKAIVRVFKVIQSEHHTLFAHLKNAIHYETYTYEYSPEYQVDWDI